MRRLRPVETTDVEPITATRFRALGPEPSFSYTIDHERGGFYSFILRSHGSLVSPYLCLDFGEGFSRGLSIPLRPTERAVYNISLEAFPSLRGLRFLPGTADGLFTHMGFATGSAALAGALFFALNTRGPAAPPLFPAPVAAPPLQAKSGPKSRPKMLAGFIKLIADIPDFLQWIRHAQSLYQSAHEPALPAFAAALDVLALGARDRSQKNGSDDPIFLSILLPVLVGDDPERAIQSFIDQGAEFSELIVSIAADSPLRDRLRDLEQRCSTLRVLDHEGAADPVHVLAQGIAAARGSWITWIEHSDLLTPNAMHAIREIMRADEQAKLFYTDHYVADPTGDIADLWAKPAFDPVLQAGMDVIGRLAVFEGALARSVVASLDGDDPHDRFLSLYLERIREEDVVHIPFPACIVKPSDGRPAGVAGPRFEPLPSISIVIPNKDAFDLMARLCHQLLHETDYARFDIRVVDNGSTDPRVLALYDAMKSRHPNFDYAVDPQDFNFSKMCNAGFRASQSDAVLFLNNDIEITHPAWLSEMAACLRFDRTGVVGAKLLYPDRTIQHNGVIVGLETCAVHWFAGYDEAAPGPMGRFHHRQTMTAVTGACLLVTRACFEAVGGFDEVVFPVAFNDIDFCLKANERGYRVVWTPFATLVHYESKTRGRDSRPENWARFEREKDAFRARYRAETFVDDAYSPLYGRFKATPTLQIPRTLPAGRKKRLPPPS